MNLSIETQTDDEGAVISSGEDPIYIGDIDEVDYCCAPPSICVANNDQAEDISGLESSPPPAESEFEEFGGNVLVVNTDVATSGVNLEIAKHSQVSEQYPQNARAEPRFRRIERNHVFLTVIIITLIGIVLGLTLGFGSKDEEKPVTMSIEAAPITPVPTRCMVSFKPTAEVIIMPSSVSTTTTSPSISSHRTTSKPFSRPSSHQPFLGHFDQTFKPSRSAPSITAMVPLPSKTLPPLFARNTHQPSIATSPIITPTPRPSSKHNTANPSPTQISAASISAPSSVPSIQSFINTTFIFQPASSTGATPSVSSSPIVPTILRPTTLLAPSMFPSATGPSRNPTLKPIQNPIPTSGGAPPSPTSIATKSPITLPSPNSTPVKIPLPLHQPISPPSMERQPSAMPSFLPTNVPSLIPSANPSRDPSTQPAHFPNPTLVPTSAPVKVPTPRPSTMSPTLSPIKTLPPTMCPSNSKESLQPTIDPRIKYSGGPFANNAELRDSVQVYLSGIGEGPPIKEWNVSGVTDFSYLFAPPADDDDALCNFNDDISRWDMSSATTTQGMFQYCVSFDQPLNSWDTANIQDMSYMFDHAYSFNQDISHWDVANVQTMNSMLFYASLFNQNLSPWKTSSLIDISYMFGYATSFNNDVSGFDVSEVTQMNGVFFIADHFQQDLSKWDTSSVTTMNSMFYLALAFNQDISMWNTASVTVMSYMFNSAESFNQDISRWDVSKVQVFCQMFENARVFNQNLCDWGLKVPISIEVGFVSWMFRNTGCEYQEDPDFSVDPPGPFCYTC